MDLERELLKRQAHLGEHQRVLPGMFSSVLPFSLPLMGKQIIGSIEQHLGVWGKQVQAYWTDAQNPVTRRAELVQVLQEAGFVQGSPMRHAPVGGFLDPAGQGGFASPEDPSLTDPDAPLEFNRRLEGSGLPHQEHVRVSFQQDNVELLWLQEMRLPHQQPQDLISEHLPGLLPPQGTTVQSTGAHMTPHDLFLRARLHGAPGLELVVQHYQQQLLDAGWSLSTETHTSAESFSSHRKVVQEGPLFLGLHLLQVQDRIHAVLHMESHQEPTQQGWSFYTISAPDFSKGGKTEP